MNPLGPCICNREIPRLIEGKSKRFLQRGAFAGRTSKPMTDAGEKGRCQANVARLVDTAEILDSWRVRRGRPDWIVGCVTRQITICGETGERQPRQRDHFEHGPM